MIPDVDPVGTTEELLELLKDAASAAEPTSLRAVVTVQREEVRSYFESIEMVESSFDVGRLLRLLRDGDRGR